MTSPGLGHGPKPGARADEFWASRPIGTSYGLALSPALVCQAPGGLPSLWTDCVSPKHRLVLPHRSGLN